MISRVNFVLKCELIELIEAHPGVNKGRVEALREAEFRIRVVIPLLSLTVRHTHLYQVSFQSPVVFVMKRLCLSGATAH